MNNLPAVRASVGAKFDMPIAVAQQFAIVFDDDHRVASVDERPQRGDEAWNFCGVQAGCRFIKDIQRRHHLSLCEIAADAQALAFTAGEGAGGLPQREVAQSQFLQPLQHRPDPRDRSEQRCGLIDGEF